jgi:hypothetical protein
MVSDFIFDGRSLSEFGYMMILDNNTDTVNVSNIEFDDIHGARQDSSQKAGYRYTGNYSATYSIMKSICNDEDDGFLSNDDIAELTRWLVRKEYKWFRYIEGENEGSDEIWYKAQFKVSKEYVGENVVGLRLEMSTNAPYGFTKPYLYKFTKSPFHISVNTDEEGYIYPNMEITLKEGGDFELYNYFEERTTILKNCVAGEVITIYGDELMQIESTNEHDYVTEFNYKFPRLVSRYSKYDNNFSSNLDCEIELRYRGIRKVGLK